MDEKALTSISFQWIFQPWISFLCAQIFLQGNEYPFSKSEENLSLSLESKCRSIRFWDSAEQRVTTYLHPPRGSPGRAFTARLASVSNLPSLRQRAIRLSHLLKALQGDCRSQLLQSSSGFVVAPGLCSNAKCFKLNLVLIPKKFILLISFLTAQTHGHVLNA